MLISWNTTAACNLRCRHCYRDAGQRDPRELTTDEGLALLGEIAAAGFKIIIFSGGEPLLRPDIYELIARARSLGLRPVCGTNGTLLTPAVAQKLKAAGLTAAGISLDSLAAATHDELRGVPGAWQAAVDGMAACREAGLPFQIHTTVFDWNDGEIEALTDFAVRQQARAHHVFFLVPTGRGKDVAAEALARNRYERLLHRIIAKQRTVSIELKPTCAPQFMRVARQEGLAMRFTKGCLAGTAYCCITPWGDVHPCPYLYLKVGNVRQEPFSAIWRQAPVLQDLRRAQVKGQCGACDYQHVCGGCRARAYVYEQDYLASDPWCLYRGDGHGAE